MQAAEQLLVWNAMPAIEKLIPVLEGDERTGAKIILKALEEPVRQIAQTQVLRVQ